MLMSMAAKEKTSSRWSAWLAPILFLLAAVAAAGPASALTCGALETRAWEKTSAPLDSRLDESLQLLEGHQSKAIAACNDALGSPLAAENAGAKLPGWAKSGLDDIAKFREELGPIPGGGKPDGGVIAKLEIGDQSFYGVNAHGQPVTLRVNAITSTHAEMDAFQQAANAGVKGGTARLYVDSELCGACGQSGGVKSLARQLGVTKLEVVTPSGVVTVNP